MDAKTLDAELTALHGGPNAARLCALHQLAALQSDDPGWQRFQLTHAWVYAMVAGDQETESALAAQLAALGGL